MIKAAFFDIDGTLVSFSNHRVPQSTIEILRALRAKGVKTILVTRFNKSPAAKLADVVLRCGSNEGPFQFGSVPAKIAQLVLMDVLFQEYCARNQQSCEEHTQTIAAALSSMHI